MGNTAPTNTGTNLSLNFTKKYRELTSSSFPEHGQLF